MQFDQSNRPEISSKLVSILLIIISVILVIHALKLSRPVTMPLAFAFFIAVLINPVQAWLERR